MTELTIGMATYNDFDGVYFTLQSLRMDQDLENVELLVVDNYGCEHTRKFVEERAGGRYILATDVVGTAAPRDLVMREARGNAVLCCDSHVMFVPGAIARLKAYYRAHPDSWDLLSGPLLADDLRTVLTHYNPVWHDERWGTWATDPRGLDPDAEPFEIQMMGLGVFSCRKDAWPGFNPAFRGFGGVEGYIHEKFRRRGGRCMCLPWLRWAHRFGRPAGVPYPVLLKDKVTNYIIGFTELGLDLDPVRDHFSARIPEDEFAKMVDNALASAQTPGDQDPSARPKTPLVEGISPPAIESDTRPARIASPTGARRAIVCFVEDKAHLIEQLLALRFSWLASQSPDTDLVVFGPEDVLERLPNDLVKIAQQPVADDPVWSGYRFINALACLNGAGAEALDRYSHLLRTDVDTFITPAWNAFSPTTFTYGAGSYAHDENVRQRIVALAAANGLDHRRMTNVGATWYGPTAVVRQAAALAELLTKRLVTDDFRHDHGHWPGWYRGVAIKYAGEVAVNHCAPDAQRSELLDVPSTSTEPIDRYPHIHCLHTDALFSKHHFMGGGYSREDAEGLDVGIIRNYCLAMSLLAREELASVR